jgi:hypothetical protein
VQGRLQQTNLTIEATTECAQSGWTLHLTIDRDLVITVQEADADPLVFVPLVDIARLEDPSIIDAF